MKKGLLLSVVASGILFAGGNIAPVAPVAPAAPAAAPAACDFWGTLAVRYDANKISTKNDTFGAKDNKATLALVMGVEKELGYGFGFGAEGAAALAGDGKFQNRAEAGELSQFYVTYKNGNTAVKLGRQALPKSLSPWAWSDRTAGILDRTFNGLVVVNTDVADTTLVGAWIHSYNDGIGAKRSGNLKIADDKGIFMLAGQYTGIANTTLTASAYFKPKGVIETVVPNSNPAVPVDANIGKAYSVWASATTKVSNVDLGLQLAYAKIKGAKATVAAAAYAGTSFDAVDAKLTLAYINKGAAPLSLGTTSAFWGNTFGGVFGGNVVSSQVTQKIARLDLGYKPSFGGKIYGGVAADKPGAGKTAIAARIGYDFTVANVAAKIEYRYAKNKDFTSRKDQRIRVQGVYKF